MSAMEPGANDEEEKEVSCLPEDYGVTRDMFREWRAPRYGNGNPQCMNNPAWEWLIQTRISAYEASNAFGEPSATEVGPGWCFSRFGQSKTQLPDGRLVLVAGEHEDHYDPDFYIYNDVVVRHPDGSIEIFGYPPEVFPPTDFHSATLVDGKLLLVGNLSYPTQRQTGATQVVQLDTETFAVTMMPTTGECPGWIHDHKAALSSDGNALIVTKGKVEPADPELGLMENFDDWRLDLLTWRWERLTQRRWEVWRFVRSDKKCNNLWSLRLKSMTESLAGTEHYEMLMANLEPGAPPDKDAMENLYRPSMPHEMIPGDEDEQGVRRVSVDGVVIRYVEQGGAVQMIVEGILPPEITSKLVEDLEAKLSKVENATYSSQRLRY